MKKTDRKTFGFNLTSSEQADVQRKAGALSIGQYARRLVLEAEPDAHCDTRQAMGKTILAIHAAVRDNLPSGARTEAVELLERALLDLRLASRGRDKTQQRIKQQ